MRHLAYELMILIKDVVSFTDGSISMMCKISLSIIQWSVRVTKRGYLRITSASLAAASPMPCIVGHTSHNDRQTQTSLDQCRGDHNYI